MWKTILSYFQWNDNVENDLSLEEACNILNQKTEEQPVAVTVPDLPINNLSTKTGIITKHEGNDYIIDDRYSFPTDLDLSIGSKVSYQQFTSNNTLNIVNVQLVENDWDTVQTDNTLWNTRVIICKVEKRDSRNLFLSPGDISVDLNKISIEFIPVVGDWLELDVKCAIDENILDLKGQILEINKISPVRHHIQTGVISYWNLGEESGTINKNIFFTKHNLTCGYIPSQGDKVIAEIIESDQNRCSWRAVKVIPESFKGNVDNFQKPFDDTPEYLEEYEGLNIENVHLTFKRLNEKQSFFVVLLNKSENNFILKSAEFLKNNGQCRVTEKPESIIVSKNSSYKVYCSCIAKNIGDSNELLLLYFENFNLGKWININVSVSYNGPKNYFQKKNITSMFEKTENQLIRGHRFAAPPRFISVDIPAYIVPKKLFDVFSRYDNSQNMNLSEELKIVKPSLFSNLSYINYEDKFHTLLHFDEIANLVMLKKYDQEKACFIANGDFLMWEIENLSERRPSLIVGDKIIASDPLKRKTIDFEGCIHKVGAKHVYIKFSPLFHDQYNGKDYSVTVVPSRSLYRRLHHAVHLAVRNLGKDILFPSIVSEKEPQVNFSVKDTCLESSDNDFRTKRMSPRDVLKRLNEINKSKSEINDQNTVENETDHLTPAKVEGQLTLEWYNKKLNSIQKEAVTNILLGTARPLPYIIFGPPGTGKTVTLIEVILQVLRLIPQSRLLVTAPSNSAADLIALRLISTGVLKPGDLVRLVSNNYALSETIPVNLVPYCATGINAKEGTFESRISSSGIQLDCDRSMLGRHRITVSTCSSASQLYYVGFPKGHFSHIIVDEAGQASEPEVLIPLIFLDKSSGQVILAGDPMQLGPVVICKLAAEYGLNESYLERLTNRFPYLKDLESFKKNNGYDPRLTTKLLYNYRSLPLLLTLYSSLFYAGELLPTIDDDASEEAMFTNKLGDILPRNKFNKPTCILFHGVDGINYQSADSPSWHNPHEAAQVFYYVNELYRMGVSSKQIGIITPYIKQVKEIRLLLTEAEFDIPKVGTIEEFQGQEFHVIILSTVRSSQEYISSDLISSLGFVSNPRRLNVAISRTKALLIIIGNPNLLYLDTYWRSVINYCFENGSYTGCDFSI